MPENPKLIVPPFNKDDIKDIAVEAVQEAYADGRIVDHGTYVEANPELAGTESELTGLQVENTKYKVPQPTTVEANPELAGSEATLTGLQVGNTKYKVAGGIKLYNHTIVDGTNNRQIRMICPYATPIDFSNITTAEQLFNEFKNYNYINMLDNSTGKQLFMIYRYTDGNCFATFGEEAYLVDTDQWAASFDLWNDFTVAGSTDTVTEL